LKKIVFVVNNLYYSGAERVLNILAESFCDENNDVTVAIFNDDVKVHYDSFKFKIVHTKIKITGNFLLKKINLFYNIRKAVKLLAPDIVICFGSPLACLTITSLLGTKIPIIVSDRIDPSFFPQKKFYRFYRHIIYPLASGCVFQTESAKNYFKGKINKISTVIPNPITCYNLPQPYLGERKKIITGVGRLDQQSKNFLLLIRAFDKIRNIFPEYKLVIYGEGEDRLLFENEIKKLHLEMYVELPGKIQHDELINNISDSDLFVFTSNIEGMPNALIEALCLGIPTITTDFCGGAARYLTFDGAFGSLIAINDEQKLINEMIKLLKTKDYTINNINYINKLRSELDIKNITDKWNKFIYMSAK
jgi:glycosyltransferase involved in cell wall biosynthesis